MTDLGRWNECTFEERPNGDVVFTIVYKTDEERDVVAAALHEALRGNKSYIDSDIVLNIDNAKTITLIVAFRANVPDWLEVEINNKKRLLN